MIKYGKLKKFIVTSLSTIMVLNINDYAFAKTAKELYGINIGYGASNTVILDNCLERTSNSGALSDAIANWSNGFKGYSKKYYMGIVIVKK